jgi:hypothetical protein
MNPKKLTFAQIVARLEAAKIPCTVKRYGYHENVTYSIEFGFNWPEELVEAVDKAFDAYGDIVPSYVDLCAESCGGDMTAKQSIAGGPKTYYSYVRWS